MDLDAVSIAIGMLGHPDNKFRSHAAKFLSYAKDPRSIEALVTALDELPPCIRYGSKDYNPEVQQLSIALGSALRNLRDVRTVPALKRAIRKGYSDWLALTLSRLGDESAVEPLLFQLRNADLYYDASYLVTMIERSNLHVEPWMKESPRSDDDAGRHRMGNQWLEWWEAHQADFRIVRSWEEVRDKARP
jgi:HEAT repeat protein